MIENNTVPPIYLAKSVKQLLVDRTDRLNCTLTDEEEENIKRILDELKAREQNG